MKRYLAEVIEMALELLCALVNHAGGCWLTNRSPLRRLYWWAIEVRSPLGRVPTPPVEEPYSYTLTTSANANSQQFTYNLVTRRLDRTG